MSRGEKFILLLVVWIFGPGWLSPAAAMNRILNIRHWVAPDHTRVVIDTSEDPSFSVDKGEKRLAIDLAMTSASPDVPHAFPLNRPGIEAIFLSPRPHSGMRVELSLPNPLETNVFKLKRFQDKPYRIVIDITLPGAVKQEIEAREATKTTPKSRVVIIDPGHGGDAPGAVGKKGTLEKNVVLAIARKLRDTLNQKKGYRAFLTRDGDYYVSFKKRLAIAKEYQADLFVSIHADAAKNPGASGSSVYCLSTGGASSEAAKILANNENLADVVGGVPGGEGNEDCDPIILDMFQNHTINQSKTFGNLLLTALDSANHLKFSTVQEAPFRVLKLPDVPSILIETAYISNPKEEKLLRNSLFQTQIAEGVAFSVTEFLQPFPAVQASTSLDPVEQKSDHSSVAERTAEAKVEAKPVSPAKRVSKTTPQPAAIYQVKRGDTLGAIAARYGTTSRDLIELNQLKKPDLLYVGLKLRLPDPHSPSN